MRVLLLVLSFSFAAFAQSAPPPKKDVLKEARAISEMMKESDPPPAKVKLTPPEQLFKNQGKATLLYALPINKPPEYAAYLRYVTDEQLFQEAIDTANGLAALPRNMIVFFRDCGEPNAFFDRSSGNITVCFELVQLLDQLYSKLAKTPEDAKALIRGAMYFVFFHEFGHALAHELKLPLTGKQEDAVDQFATMLLLEQGLRGEQAVMAGATFFLALSELPNKKIKFWDEHSLDAQRFYNISCWLFGAEPFHQVDLVARGLLPSDRAGKCGQEYQDMRYSWKTVADPKLKRPLK